MVTDLQSFLILSLIPFFFLSLSYRVFIWVLLQDPVFHSALGDMMGSCCLSELGMARALLCSHLGAFLLNWLSPSSCPQSLTVSVCAVHFPLQLQLLFVTVNKWLFTFFLSFDQSRCSSLTRLLNVRSIDVCVCVCAHVRMPVSVWMWVCKSDV